MVEFIRIQVLSSGRFLAAFLGCAAICCHWSPNALGDAAKSEPEKLEQATTLEIIRRIPHTGYSEGLDFHEGFLWHALPKEILKIDPKEGEIVARFTPATDYSESLKWFKGQLFNLSYSDNGIYVGKPNGKVFEFQRKGTTPEKTGWGIEKVGDELVVTGDHSKKLYFLDPQQLKVKRSIEVAIKDLEDLAWDGTGLWTSSFTSHQGKIFRIDPKSGEVSALYSLPDPSECPIIDGIAFDGVHLWVTGKNCVSIYLVKIPSGMKKHSEKKKS